MILRKSVLTSLITVSLAALVVTLATVAAHAGKNCIMGAYILSNSLLGCECIAFDTIMRFRSSGDMECTKRETERFDFAIKCSIEPKGTKTFIEEVEGAGFSGPAARRYHSATNPRSLITWEVKALQDSKSL